MDSKKEAPTAVQVSVLMLCWPVAVGALVVPAALLQGLVFAQLWSWYLGPMGAPHISWARAVGIDMILSMLRPSKPAENNKTSWTHFFVVHFMWPLVALVVGWACKSFV